MKIIRAHIKDGKVINLTVGDTMKKWKAPDGVQIIELSENQTDAVMNGTYDGKKFSPPIVEKVIVEKTKQELLEERIKVLEDKIQTLEKIHG